MSKTLPDDFGEKYVFDENIINELKKRFPRGLEDMLGPDDANRLDSDLEWMKDSELVGVRDRKLTELVFFSYKKKIYFQIEPDSRRFFGTNMYVTVRPYIDNDGKPQIVKLTRSGLDVYNFGWNITEQFNETILDQKKQQCEDICTMKKCKDTHKLVSIEDVKKNIEENNPILELVDNHGNLLIRRRDSPRPYSGPSGGRRTIKKNKKKKSTRRKTKRIIIKKKKLNKRKN